MKLFNKLWLLVFISLLNVSCAMPLKPDEIGKIKTVGVINQFPEFPNFATIGTTIFNNDFDSIKDPQFRQKVSQVTIDYLKGKGYTATEIADKDELAKKNVDLVLYIIPRDVYEVPGTFGFGVNQRSLLGARMAANTYVALNIGPFLHGESKGNAFYLQKLIKLDIEELPEKWTSLSADQKKHVEQVLNKNIEESLTELLAKVGI